MKASQKHYCFVFIVLLCYGCGEEKQVPESSQQPSCQGLPNCSTGSNATDTAFDSSGSFVLNWTSLEPKASGYRLLRKKPSEIEFTRLLEINAKDPALKQSGDDYEFTLASTNNLGISKGDCFALVSFSEKGITSPRSETQCL